MSLWQDGPDVDPIKDLEDFAHSDASRLYPTLGGAHVRKCRVCGCTDDNACVMKRHTYPKNIVTCWWVDLDTDNKHGGPLCSACVNPETADLTEMKT